MAIMFSNPKGRMAQIAADKRYLGASKSEPYFSARTADVGGLKDVNVRKVSSRVGLTGQKTSASPFQADIDEALTDLARKTAVDDAVRAARPKVPLLEQVRRGLGKRVPSIAAGAAMLPLGVAAVVGLDRANRAASSAFQRAAESGRFNRAMRGFDPSQMGDPSFQYRYEQDPQGMMGALRESFGVLNRIAPNVAKDPTLAREYMKRLTLDPEYRQPPEEYLRQVQGAVQLENALQSAQPSLFEGLGTAPGLLLKGM
jgi:hypothetical protein